MTITQQQDAEIAAVLIDSDEYLEIHRANWKPFLAKMDLLWNPPIPQKGNGDAHAGMGNQDQRNDRVVGPKPSSKSPGYSLTSKGTRSHHKPGETRESAGPRPCAWEGCEVLVDPPRQRCSEHVLMHKAKRMRDSWHRAHPNAGYGAPQNGHPEPSGALSAILEPPVTCETPPEAPGA